MFDTNAFGPLFQIADHFAFEVASDGSMGSDATPQETHRVHAGKAGNGMTHQRGVDAAEGSGTAEHEVGGVFALLGRPVVLES